MNEREPIPQEETENNRPLNPDEFNEDFKRSLEEAEQLEKANPENPDAS